MAALSQPKVVCAEAHPFFGARYRELLLDLVAATLDDENPSTVEAEMRELLAALS